MSDQDPVLFYGSPRPFAKRAVRVRRSVWDEMKFEVMYRACLAKFSQNEDLKQLLFSTGDWVIHEDCRDPWWGGTGSVRC